jgi:hypothetical protein
MKEGEVLTIDTKRVAKEANALAAQIKSALAKLNR